MRICIYKTDEAPDLTLFLQQGLSIPSDTRDRQWVLLKTITRGELGVDRAERISKAGYCVEILGRTSVFAPPVTNLKVRTRRPLGWLRLPWSTAKQ